MASKSRKGFLQIIIPIILISGLAVYFSLSLVYFPNIFSNQKQFEPESFFEVNVDKTFINLGDSFNVDIVTQNIGEYADIHLLSVAFPDLEQISKEKNDVVKIITYDFTHSPRYISKGDELGSNYSGGLETVASQYPSIEAMNRPAPPDVPYHLSLNISPKKLGEFRIFVKSVDIPHTNEKSHFPRMGLVDHQSEYVSVFKIQVNP